MTAFKTSKMDNTLRSFIDGRFRSLAVSEGLSETIGIGDHGQHEGNQRRLCIRLACLSFPLYQEVRSNFYMYIAQIKHIIDY